MFSFIHFLCFFFECMNGFRQRTNKTCLVSILNAIVKQRGTSDFCVLFELLSDSMWCWLRIVMRVKYSILLSVLYRSTIWKCTQIYDFCRKIGCICVFGLSADFLLWNKTILYWIVELSRFKLSQVRLKPLLGKGLMGLS